MSDLPTKSRNFNATRPEELASNPVRGLVRTAAHGSRAGRASLPCHQGSHRRGQVFESPTAHHNYQSLTTTALGFSQHWQPYHHFSKLEAQAQILHKNLTVDLTYEGPHGGDGDIPHRSTKVC
jgi:hypothetical protein